MLFVAQHACKYYIYRATACMHMYGAYAAIAIASLYHFYLLAIVCTDSLVECCVL